MSARCSHVKYGYPLEGLSIFETAPCTIFMQLQQNYVEYREKEKHESEMNQIIVWIYKYPIIIINYIKYNDQYLYWNSVIL